MTTDYTPRMRALDRISRSIAEHQPVRRENGIGSTCRNYACQGVIFLNLKDRYNHQAVVLVNDLQRELDFYLESVREDAKEEGREVTAEELADIRNEFLILAPAPEPEPVHTNHGLGLHKPLRRYKACFRDKVSYPTAVRAFQVHLNDSMRGYESVVIERAEDVPFIEVCAECFRIENSYGVHRNHDDNHDDELHGIEVSVNASSWPCPTAIAASHGSVPAPKGA